MSELTLETVKEFLSRRYNLVEVGDYELSKDNLRLVQKCIWEQDSTQIHESLEEDFFGPRLESMDWCVEELKKDLDKHYDSEDIKEFFNNTENLTAIEDEIYSRDTSSPVHKALDCVGEIPIYYKTGFEVEYGYDQESYDDNFTTIKEALKISENDHRFNKNIKSLLANASYGGILVIFFTHELEPLMDLRENNIVTFENPHVAVVDHYNGSGDDDQFVGLTVSYDLDPEDLRIDKLTNYSYTYDVCSMGDHWCDGTRVHFSKE